MNMQYSDWLKTVDKFMTCKDIDELYDKLLEDIRNRKTNRLSSQRCRYCCENDKGASHVLDITAYTKEISPDTSTIHEFRIEVYINGLRSCFYGPYRRKFGICGMDVVEFAIFNKLYSKKELFELIHAVICKLEDMGINV